MKSAKAVLREKFRAINATIKKKERSQINNQTYTSRNQKKKTKTKVIETNKTKIAKGNSSQMQWLGFHASNAGCAGSFPGRGIKAKVPTCCTAWPKKKKKNQSRNK